MKLYLVRHAQSNPTHDLPDPEWSLSNLGRTQADSLVAVLKDLKIEKFYSSPYKRCIETIMPFVESTEVPVQVVGDLREHKIADSILPDFNELWEKCWNDFNYCLPNCETSASAQKRMVRAVLGICASSTHDTIGISSHGNVIGLLLNSLDPSFSSGQTRALCNPDIICLDYAPGGLSRDESFRSPQQLRAIASRHEETVFPEI